MSVSIKPLEDRIVIQQVEAEETTASGLVLPGSAQEKPQEVFSQTTKETKISVLTDSIQ